MRETPFYPSLTRPILMGGVEREMMIPIAGLVLMLLLGFRLNLVTPSLAAALVLVVLPRLRRLNRRDPQAFRVLTQHVAISGYYAAQGGREQPRKARTTF